MITHDHTRVYVGTNQIYVDLHSDSVLYASNSTLLKLLFTSCFNYTLITNYITSQRIVIRNFS